MQQCMTAFPKTANWEILYILFIYNMVFMNPIGKDNSTDDPNSQQLHALSCRFSC